MALGFPHHLISRVYWVKFEDRRPQIGMSLLSSIYVYTGWWFGTCFIFPNSWDDDPI